MMTITPTHRPWFSSGRLTAAVLLLALGSGALLMLTGADSPALLCLASVG